MIVQDIKVVRRGGGMLQLSVPDPEALKGPKGDCGAKGEKGEKGDKGDTGDRGSDRTRH